MARWHARRVVDDELLGTAAGAFGNGHADGAAYQERSRIAAQGVLAGGELEVSNDFSARAGCAADFIVMCIQKSQSEAISEDIDEK